MPVAILNKFSAVTLWQSIYNMFIYSFGNVPTVDVLLIKIMVPNGYVRFPEGTKTKEDKSEASIKHTALQLSRASHFSRPHFLGQPCGVKQAAVWNGAPAPVISVESRASWTTFESRISQDVTAMHTVDRLVSALLDVAAALYFIQHLSHGPPISTHHGSSS